MVYVSATETQNKFASIIDIARREPVTIQKNGRDSIVMMAVEDYEKLSRHMINAFHEFCDRAGEEAMRKGLNEKELDLLLQVSDDK